MWKNQNFVSLLTAGKIFKLETKEKALTFFLSGDLA